MEAALPCHNDKDLCFVRGSPNDEPYMVNRLVDGAEQKTKEVNTYSTEADYSWSYRFKFLVDH